MANNPLVRLWAQRQVLARVVLGALVENVNGLAFLAGAIWLYIGIRGFSPSAADIVGGAIVMAIGAWPYVRRPRKP